MLDLLNDTILRSWHSLALFSCIYIIFRLYKEKKINNFREEIFLFLFLVYLYLLVSIITYGDLNLGGTSNFVPFKEISRYVLFSPLFYSNVVGNVVLYMPLGYFMGKYLNVKKISVILILSVIISLFAEIIQTDIGRTFDIDDIILNIIGSVFGFVIYNFLCLIYRKLPSFMQKDGLLNVMCIIIIISLLLYVLNVVGVVSLI